MSKAPASVVICVCLASAGQLEGNKAGKDWLFLLWNRYCIDAVQHPGINNFPTNPLTGGFLKPFFPLT